MILKVAKEKNGITLIALVITIIVLLILAGVSIATLMGPNGILTQANTSKDETAKSGAKEKVQMEVLGCYNNDGTLNMDKLKENLKENLGISDADITENSDGSITVLVDGYKLTVYSNGDVMEVAFVDKPEVSEEPSFSRAYGVIEIEFLSGTSYDIVTKPNEPNMISGMKKVYWKDDGTEVTEGDSEFDENKWYEYKEQSGTTIEGGTSHWANAKVIEDGVDSYFVWIPRYAYRIVYFDTPEHAEAYRADKTKTEGIVGYSDARGIVDEEGKTPRDLQEPVTSVAVGKNELRTHPAFETDLSQGGWSSKLEGIWVAKYEVSESGATIQSTPGVSSYRNKTIGEMYDLGYAYDRGKESHLMKNSEWGAVAYLTESKYGRNGTAVTKNDDSSYYTAGGNGATAATNKLQSTTGNEYGIFDTVGGSYEYVAGYLADSSQSSGNSFASNNPLDDNAKNDKTESTPYATVYQMASSNVLKDNYNLNLNKIFGDATTETSTSEIGTTSWYSADSYFVGNNYGNHYPFFRRGGNYGHSYAGLFFFYFSSGYSGNDFGFRVCLAI